MDIEELEKLLGGPRDGALLRLTLGRLYLQKGAASEAIGQLRAAVNMDSGFTAAWRELGRALAKAGHDNEAADAYRRGIEVATTRGDKQAEKEMRVFLRRLE